MNFFTFLCKNLLRRRTRSVLTAFGVAVAVGASVALLGISNSFEKEALRAFDKRGADIVVVERDVPIQTNSDLDAAVVPLVRALPHVKIVAPALVYFYSYPAEDDQINAMLQGWEHDNYAFDSFEMVEGRKLRADDKNAVILGTGLASALNKKVGDEIEIRYEQFKVVGVYESHTTYENLSSIILLPVMQRIMAREDRITGFSLVIEHSTVKAEDEQRIAAICKAINALEVNGKSAGLEAKAASAYVRESMHNRLAHAMALMTSTIAVFMGAIGVLNTMIMSVVERVREICILRAIGWRKSRVVQMILGESVLLSLVGAVLGVVGAYFTVRALSMLPAVQGVLHGRLEWPDVARGFALALLVGLLGGAYPAFRASRLLPSEGLRYE